MLLRFIYLYLFFCLHWDFVAAQGLSLVVASEGYFLAVVLGLSVAVASAEELPYPRIKLGFPAFQADSLPSDLPGKL